ncbi:MAG: type II secretion system protein [Bacilli bacterium]
MKNKKNQKGFTLVELLVVITIMGVLGTVLVTNYTKYVDKSKQVVVDEQLNEVVQTFELAFVEGVTFNETTILNYQDIFDNNIDIENLYESLSSGNLPENATLTIDASKITYSLNGKTSSYTYA